MRPAFRHQPAAPALAAWSETAPFVAEMVADFGPRKDYMVRLEGPSVVDAMGIFATRWNGQIAAGVQYSELATPFTLEGVMEPNSDGIQVQVVATMPEPFGDTTIAETLLRAISQASEYIYIEDQYFRSPILADALITRMLEVPTLELIVVTRPVDEWLDPGCWHTHLQAELFHGIFPERFGLYRLRTFDWSDTGCILCIDEVLGVFQDIDVHSKLVLIDDLYLQVGSCNHHNRGLLYEGELAVALVDEALATETRHRILSNLLGDYYTEASAPEELLGAFENAATYNDAVYAEWDNADFDLDLDGDPLAPWWQPEGFVYTMVFGAPEDCFFESVGEDVTSAR